MATKKTTKTPVAIPHEVISLSDQAYEQLEELIVTMRLAPGTPVSESQLSTMLGIGRTPIREAIQRLSHEHLVSIMPKRGIFISDLNPQKQLRVLETRRELERLICTKSAKRCNSEERKQFERIAKDFKKAAKEKNEKLFLKVDKELNDLTIIAAKNEYASKALSMLHGMSRRFWFGNFHQVGDIAVAATLHANIAEAICEGNEKKAGVAVDKLLDYIEEFTRKTVMSHE
ncbi:GntR family transcriptional regulator [Polynucleobacter sp. 71A-WALBACH]|uniref:GntR family transcriptional regulator n=1 Tax=Polynucleobacter sp. 71A-WALBACH TaxID=2689097 RepID=UPI0021081C80|nr:GntR family transcriptional regulator [Polynucleobacter sp. 71A-WALBACH]